MGDVLRAYSYDKYQASLFAVRYIFDLTFFMIIKMAFLNIIFGIIIDTFARKYLTIYLFL